MTIEYNISKSEYCISIIAISGDMPAGVAECSKIDSKSYYFNRLFVHQLYRKKGISVKLLSILLEEIKQTRCTLELDINPYGDMSYEELEQFYIKHGFVKKEIVNKSGTYFKFFFNEFAQEEMYV